MLYYNRIGISEEVVHTTSNRSKECMISHYCFFNHGFTFQDSVCNGSHDLIILYLNISYIAIITVKNVDYHFLICNISKSKTMNLLENSVHEDCENV